MGGTLTIGCRKTGAVASTTSLWGLERSVSSSTAACTLLGPEGSEPALVAGPPSDFLPSVTVVAGRGECRPYVENYTVDASIFDSTSSGVGSDKCLKSVSCLRGT